MGNSLNGQKKSFQNHEPTYQRKFISTLRANYVFKISIPKSSYAGSNEKRNSR